MRLSHNVWWLAGICKHNVVATGTFEYHFLELCFKHQVTASSQEDPCHWRDKTCFCQELLDQRTRQPQSPPLHLLMCLLHFLWLISRIVWLRFQIFQPSMTNIKPDVCVLVWVIPIPLNMEIQKRTKTMRHLKGGQYSLSLQALMLVYTMEPVPSPASLLTT